MKKVVAFFTGFLLLNVFILGFMQVYKTSYNAMNSDHIIMAGISKDEVTGNTQLQILDKKFNFEPFSPLSDDIIYTLYLITNNNLKVSIGFLELLEYLTGE